MKAVLFDLGGTLWAPFGAMSREAAIESAAEYAFSQIHPRWFDGLTPDEVRRRRQEFVAGLYEGVSAAPSERDGAVSRGAFADSVFKEIPIEETVVKVFRRVWGREPDDRGSALAFGHALTKHSTAYPESSRVLAEVRALYPCMRLGIVSNTIIQPEVLDHYLQECGLYRYFDFRVYSSSAGWRKPHPAIYSLALAEAGVRADEAVFVGDRVAEDVKAPRRLGMRAVLCVRGSFRGENPRADAVVYDLTPVPDLLRKFMQKESTRRLENS